VNVIGVASADGNGDAAAAEEVDESDEPAGVAAEAVAEEPAGATEAASDEPAGVTAEAAAAEESEAQQKEDEETT
jgi:hypothetical protein